MEDFIPKKKGLTEFKINEFITLKLEKGKTVIYVNNEKFLQCKYLLIEILEEEIKEFDYITSIDDVSRKLDHSLENSINNNKLEPETEFWGHCSNLQTWSENQYDTHLLHSNLAFPLLKKLTDVGDPTAKRVFKDEIAERLTSGYSSVAQYLIQENYLEYFNNEEIDLLMESFFEQIEKRFREKQDNFINDLEIDALLNIIRVNMNSSKILLINQLRPIDNISKEIQMGFLFEKDRISALGLNRCGLKSLPSSIGNFECLKSLYLTENRIKYLPESIGNLTILKKLYLSDNHLIKLPSEIGNLINLKELHLNHNFIQILPESISKLKNLEILSIWGNQLRTLPKNLNEMSSLRIFGLSFNQLKRFSDFSLNFENLEILDLSNNYLEVIPENFEQLKSLKALWLNNNPIKTLPESLKDIKSLKSLYIVNTPVGIKPDIKTYRLLNDLKRMDVNIWK
ncbi:MAG: leucine-rich repeat domain-containing protein [Promethearchaeota archaeon]